MGNSKNSGGIVIVILLAGLLYGVMMGAVYSIGVFFISIFGRLFSWIAHRYLLATNNTEHHIQSLFSSLDREAKDLEGGKSTTLSLLDEAGRNAWKENLLGKINESITLLSDTAGRATDESRELKKLLESSKYRDIFNFVKYGNWIKKQILEPIESILLLLEKNHAILMDTIDSLNEQIRETSDSSLRNPLELQKNRLILQKESFEKNIELLRQYQEKLR